MAIGSPKGGGAMSDINVTPLVDVMLVLLIIFMVAVPMIERERQKNELKENRDRQQRLIELNLPLRAPETPAKPDETPGTTVQLGITTGLVVSLDGQTTADCSTATTPQAWRPCLDALEAALIGSEAAKEHGVSINADDRVPFGFVVASIHRVRKAGIERVGMLPR